MQEVQDLKTFKQEHIAKLSQLQHEQVVSAPMIPLFSPLITVNISACFCNKFLFLPILPLSYWMGMNFRCKLFSNILILLLLICQFLTFRFIFFKKVLPFSRTGFYVSVARWIEMCEFKLLFQ